MKTSPPIDATKAMLALPISFALATVSGAKPGPPPDRVVVPTRQLPTDVQNARQIGGEHAARFHGAARPSALTTEGARK